jgi:hypothetical protein
MAWTWSYSDLDGAPIMEPQEPCVTSGFPSQADAEAFVSDTWRELLASGVGFVTLLDGDREVYGPMNLRAE